MKSDDNGASGAPLPPSRAAAHTRPRLNLSPARWIWLPSGRTLANTFVLFRREFDLDAAPKSAAGWVLADSRYRLTVNGERVQWGPAPSDPRHAEADPADIARFLRPGRNVIGVEVLYYGHGEGTWPMGKPGLIALFHVEHADGRREEWATNDSWRCRVDRAHRPGQYRRWFLRALQEEFDARVHPHGWDIPGYEPDASWMPADELPGSAPDRPAFASRYPDYAGDSNVVDRDASEIRPRSIPLLTESLVAPLRLSEAGRIAWRRDPEDWFQFRVPGSFEVTHDDAVARPAEGGTWILPATGDGEGVYATFEWEEQGVGWPTLTVDAPEGVVVEVMCQEAHDSGKTQWLDSQFFNWSRFICHEGMNHIEPFDFESFRWVQVHVRNTTRPVEIRDVAMRRRRYPWPAEPAVTTSEAPLQRLFDATVNTLHNSAQETSVDGMARERQQYSGDVGHQLHPVRQTLGADAFCARYLSTFGHGLALGGYYMDSWPGYDRLARIAQRQAGATVWGPLLDHGVGFCFDHFHHWQQTGDLEASRESYPGLLRFAGYLLGLRRRTDGLLPVEDVGECAVWIDHDAYKKQSDKRCAWNLYASAMLVHALAPLARAFGDEEVGASLEAEGRALLAVTVAAYWDPARAQFVANLPHLRSGEETELRLCDRSLATALLYDQAPGGSSAAMVATLAECPPELGLSYPANAPWRMWALGRHGRADAVLRELRERWTVMPSVLQNNTLAEFFDPRPDSTNQWSHCPIAPLIAAHQVFAGVSPLVPGCEEVAVRPQFADLPDLWVTTHTPRGQVIVTAKKAEKGGHEAMVTLPSGVRGELHLPASAPAPASLDLIGDDPALGLRRYRLPGDGGEQRFLV